MASKLLTSLAERLFPDPEERLRFIDALEKPRRYPPCAIWTDREQGPEALDLPRAEAEIDWLPDWVLRLDTEQPGKHPLHDAGAFYSLDFSSVFAASAMSAIPEAKSVLDMCAAPGGKSVFASRALDPELLVSNEVIGKRLGILRHNLTRCRIPNAFTQRLDPAEIADVSPRAFDMVIADAPCSGQSLLAKGIENPGCFHPATLNRNMRRQRRILSACTECIAPGGWLLYSTCTFAFEENEKLIAWVLKRTENLEVVDVPHLEPWRSPNADFPAYRLYPHSGLGAGAFVCLLRRSDDGERREIASVLQEYPVG